MRHIFEEPAIAWRRGLTRRPRLWLSGFLLAFALSSPLPLRAQGLPETAIRIPPSEIRLAPIVPGDPTPTRVFREFSKRTAPGLPQSTVMSLLQDRQGRLWMATLDGIGIFDGVEVKSLTDAGDAPFDGPAVSLAEGRQGEVLVGGTRSIHIFDGDSWQRLDAPGTSFSIVEGLDGRLLRLDASGRFLRSAEVGSGEWRDVELGDLGKAQDRLGAGVAIERGAEGGLWLAGRRGVAHVDEDDLDSQGPGNVEIAVEAPGQISAFLALRDGGLLIGTLDEGLFHLPTGASEWRRLPLPGWRGGWIRSLAEDRRGRLWAGGNSGSVAFGSPDGHWTIWDGDHGLARNGVLDILADREGSLWFALNGRGAHQWIGESWSHRTLWGDDRLDPRLQVFGIRGTPDGQGFWAAVFGRGVWKWDGQELFEFPEGPFQDARIAFEPEPGVLWIGARFGAWELRDGTWRRLFTFENGFVWEFEQDPDGRWWAATSTAGLFVEDPEGWRPAAALNQSLPDLAVRDILWRGEQLWAGTLSGLAVFENGELVEVNGQSGMPSAVNGLLAVDDSVWVVGSGGIAIWRPDQVRRIRPREGLPGGTIYSIARDRDGLIWLGGSSGVAQQIDGEADGESWRLFNTANGLIEGESNHQALWPAPDGSIFVGTMASLARYHPEVIPLPEPDLGLQWTVRPRGALPPEQRSIRLEWQAPWMLPRPIEYRVRVPRLDKAWSSPRRERFVQLDNLTAGGWRIEVAARFVGEQQWTEAIVAGWELEPFWWETRAFRFFCLLLALAAIGLLIRWRTGHLRRRAEKLERAVEEAVQELKTLSGLLPICSVCKKVRDDDGYWQQIERYIDHHSEAVLSHSLCPHCVDEHYADYSGKNREASDTPTTSAD